MAGNEKGEGEGSRKGCIPTHPQTLGQAINPCGAYLLEWDEEYDGLVNGDMSLDGYEFLC